MQRFAQKKPVDFTAGTQLSNNLALSGWRDLREMVHRLREPQRKGRQTDALNLRRPKVAGGSKVSRR